MSEKTSRRVLISIKGNLIHTCFFEKILHLVPGYFVVNLQGKVQIFLCRLLVLLKCKNSGTYIIHKKNCTPVLFDEITVRDMTPDKYQRLAKTEKETFNFKVTCGTVCHEQIRCGAGKANFP